MVGASKGLRSKKTVDGTNPVNPPPKTKNNQPCVVHIGTSLRVESGQQKGHVASKWHRERRIKDEKEKERTRCNRKFHRRLVNNRLLLRALTHEEPSRRPHFDATRPTCSEMARGRSHERHFSPVERSSAVIRLEKTKKHKERRRRRRRRSALPRLRRPLMELKLTDKHAAGGERRRPRCAILTFSPGRNEPDIISCEERPTKTRAQFLADEESARGRRWFCTLHHRMDQFCPALLKQNQ